MITKIKEYIAFGDFNSRDAGWYLQKREAPTPGEKEIVESIPYMQGELDFSSVLGERVFEPREITYEFKLPFKEYEDRKTAERMIKSQMVTKTEQKLFDTHDRRYYWMGKVKHIKVADDPIKKNLVATIVFKCYPFAFHENEYFDDVWDTFDFNNDFSAWTKWGVSGEKSIYFVNCGDTSISPTIKCSSNFNLIDDNGTIYNFKKGENTDFTLILKPGVNYFTAQGDGYISMHFSIEVMA